METVFQAGRYRLPLDTTHIMGIINVTPDSFSDGGQYTSAQAVLTRAKELCAQGAAIIDIGAQSTRPGAAPISWEAEWARLKPVLPGLVAQLDTAISVDTFYPEVAVRALAAGVDIINDVSGFSPEMFSAVSGSTCGCIILYPHGGMPDILADVSAFFSKKRTLAAQHGVSPQRLCFDPGIGFEKSYEEDLLLLANIPAVKVPGHAFLMAASKKRVIGRAAGDVPVAQRLPGTLTAHTIAQLGGADILRVHDVAQAVQGAHVADAIRRRQRPCAGVPAIRPPLPQLDRIHIHGLRLYAYHGVNPEEKQTGQPFLLTLTMKADLSAAKESDCLNDTVNYAAVRKVVQQAFTAQSYDLIERAGKVVCDAVLAAFPAVEEIALLLKKPEAPMNAQFEDVAVEMIQRREGSICHG